MNNRDEQIAAIAAETAHLDQERLRLFAEKVREAYRRSSVVDRVATVEEIEDRSPSDFRILSNQELRRVDQFNSANFSWDQYCAQLGRSVAHGERTYIFNVLRDRIPDVDVSQGVGFGGLHDAINRLVTAGRRPDLLFAPTTFMVGAQEDHDISIEWDSDEHAYLPSPINGVRLQIIWSSAMWPLDRFIVGERNASVWRVKLDPRGGGRLTVAIGEQRTPVYGVIWLAETVAKYEIAEPAGYLSFRPDVAPDDLAKYGA